MKKKILFFLSLPVYLLFAVYSYQTDYKAGIKAVENLLSFSGHMLLFLPFAFILIGLFEVWIKRQTVEQYLGRSTGFSAYLLAVALAGTTVGGLYMAFPLSYSLFKKGAKLGVIFTYLSAACICRIPMTVFEASFIGIKFTIVRFIISLPLVIVSSALLGNYLEKKNYRLQHPEIKKEK
ncbi:MAG TPA: permease [Spirochaetota bacterium]|nr:permease [Spirochaetota bacterium]